MKRVGTYDEWVDEVDRAGAFAFPGRGEAPGGGVFFGPGMTLRDWFAGQALLGMYQRMRPACREFEANAADAYAQADAMLKARSE